MKDKEAQNELLLTPEEAIRIIERWQAGNFATRIDDMNPALNLAVKALRHRAQLAKVLNRKPLDRPELREKIFGYIKNADYTLTPKTCQEVADQILALIVPKDKVYCGGENTGCDHEDKPTSEECFDCPYMTMVKPKPPLLSDEEILNVITKATHKNELFQQVITRQDKAVAQAQRELCIKWYEGD